jgi:hypothetical protein
VFYAVMAAAGLVVEGLFALLGGIPASRPDTIVETGFQWNYTTVLNIVFLLLAAVLLWRFFTTGGRAMLAMMGGGPDETTDDHSVADRHGHHDRPPR